MEFELSPQDLLARARADMRAGLPVVLIDGDARALVLSAETLSPDRLSQARRCGPVTLAITDWRAKTLKVRIYDGDIARIALPEDSDVSWVAAMADPVDDLSNPMKGPFTGVRDGNPGLARAGINLAKLAHLLPAVLVGEASEPQPKLTHLPVSVLNAHALALPQFQDVISARLPIELAGETRLHVFRPGDGGEEHYAVEVGVPARSEPVLTRLHSACFTGDILGSLKCDCGPQLKGALAAMGEVGAGVLLYLNQEGRGIGLANKMRAYALQDQGFDTVEANHRLGFEDDERDFRIGSQILKSLGFSSVRLMTNNPAKLENLRAQGISVVERVPLHVGHTHENEKYLAVKAQKSGHMM